MMNDSDLAESCILNSKMVDMSMSTKGGHLSERAGFEHSESMCICVHVG